MPELRGRRFLELCTAACGAVLGSKSVEGVATVLARAASGQQKKMSSEIFS